MSSLTDELHRREATAREEAEDLRRRIEELNQRLAVAEEQVRRLEITRETVTELFGAADSDRADPEPRPSPPEHQTPPGPARQPIGVLAVPARRAGLEASALPQAYQDLLEAVTDAAEPVRAATIAAACGLSTDKSKVEGLRSKLKRLVERGWLIENGPGRFAVAPGGTERTKT